MSTFVFAAGDAESDVFQVGMCISDFDDTFMQYLMDAAKEGSRKAWYRLNSG